MVTSTIGLVASLALTLDKIALLENPNTQLNCDFSVLVSCGANLNSAQGSVFGFPNPLLGLMFWSAVMAVGIGLLAGATFAGWFWMLFSLGTGVAFVLVVWFIGQSIFVLGVLCPWCMVTWAVTIPLFFAVTLHTLWGNRLPASVRRVVATGSTWLPLATFACYLVIAGLAHWKLDLLGQIL